MGKFKDKDGNLRPVKPTNAISFMDGMLVIKKNKKIHFD
jgi:hypothetical protein